MAHPHKVIHSVNLHGDNICVDVFQRADGSFGFDEFRRDAEDGRGWFSIGHHGAQRYATHGEAVQAAIRHVGWFDGV
ncbi:hypothetical protein ABMC88_12365 [Sulfitobacter sp. HNIBRBA2951]|uniref:hypothetical protein n=1 Tax=Sulfitobacter aquimarinus TaxID=3158557 RepID=UPI0032DF2D3B